MSATGREKAFEMAFYPRQRQLVRTGMGRDRPGLLRYPGGLSVINEVRADGGDVIVSAGGYNGTKLGQVCSSAAATAAAYQQVITTYGLHAIDFDLEEPEIKNSTAISYDLGAAQILQKQDPGLFVSVTMPSTTTGANYSGKQLLDEAKSLGFTPNDYTIMPFDGGFSGGSSQVTALQDFNAQLVSTFGWSSSEAYAHEGFSGMNGRSDSAEYFYQSDFQTVLNFAESSGMSRFTFWSVNRDRNAARRTIRATLQRVQQCRPEPVGLHRLYSGVREEHVGDPDPDPDTHPDSDDVLADADSHPDDQLSWLLRVGLGVQPGVRLGRARCRTAATSGPPTSGTTTRSRAAHPAPGTTTAPAETWRRANPARRPAPPSSSGRHPSSSGATLISRRHPSTLPAPPSSPAAIPQLPRAIPPAPAPSLNPPGAPFVSWRTPWLAICQQ